MKPVRLAREANREITEAATWYESRQTGLSDKFLDEIDGVLVRIRRHPESFTVIPDTSPKLAIRRALLSRFPYALIFLELEKEIRVIAAAHLKRRPTYWLRRLPM